MDPIRNTKNTASIYSVHKHKQPISTKSNQNGTLTKLKEFIEHFSQIDPNTNVQRKINDEIRKISLYKHLSQHRVISELQAIDTRVKAHEQAHMSSLGGASGGSIQYDYVIGPNGRRYAVGGSIKVDLQLNPANPKETIRKARQLRRAAFAPGNPSAADLRIAAEAYRMEQRARKELEKQEAEHAKEHYQSGFLYEKSLDNL